MYKACRDLSAEEFHQRLERQPLQLRCNSVSWYRSPILLRGDEHKQMARHAFSLDVPGSAHRAICVLFVELISALPRRVVSGYTFELAHATMSYLAWIRSRYIVARHLLRRGTVVNPEWLLLDVKADCDRAGYPITPDFGRAADLVLGPATPRIEIISAGGGTRWVLGSRRLLPLRSEIVGGHGNMGGPRLVFQSLPPHSRAGDERDDSAAHGVMSAYNERRREGERELARIWRHGDEYGNNDCGTQVEHCKTEAVADLQKLEQDIERLERLAKEYKNIVVNTQFKMQRRADKRRELTFVNVSACPLMLRSSDGVIHHERAGAGDKNPLRITKETR